MQRNLKHTPDYLIQAAIRFCLADDLVSRSRRAWKQLKRDHDGEETCIQHNRWFNENIELCERCTEFDLQAYSFALKTRASAKASLVRAYRKGAE